MDVVNIGIENQSIALPIDKKLLGEFISGLLGQPQSLSRTFEDPFSADHQWFIHFFSLILQRVQQQNSPEPLSFEVSISYQNNIERRITSWQAFQHFSETQNIISVGAKFNLSFLIQFPSKDIPERQELILDFDASHKHIRRGVLESLLGSSLNTGHISFEIRHTERTWADDISRLIENEIVNIQIPEQRWKTYLRNVFAPFAIFSFPVMLLASIVYSQFRTQVYNIQQNVRSLTDIKQADLEALHNKVDALLLEAASSSDGRTNNGKTILYSILLSVLIYLIFSFLVKPSPSFVVLSTAATNNRNKTLAQQRKKGLLLFLSIIGSLIMGVAGNFLYDSIK